jgi:hypothetical protein
MPAAHVRSVILRGGTGLKMEPVERGDSNAQEFTDPHDGARTQGYSHWPVHVDDPAAAYPKMLAAGATDVSPPADGVRAGMRFAYGKDPEGNLLELIQPAS